MGLLVLLTASCTRRSGLSANCQSFQMGPAAACPDFRAYTQLHWEVVFGHRPARWLVTDDPDGLADRLVNAVSAFLVALVTKRALCVLPAHRFGPQTPMEVAYDAPFIDWTCRQGSGGSGTPPPPPPASDQAAAAADPHDRAAADPSSAARGEPAHNVTYLWQEAAEDEPPSEMSTIDRSFGDLHQKLSTYYKTFVLSDLTSLPENDASVWKLWLHRSLSIGLFNNMHHNQELLQLGLRPDTAFGCIASYLFRPNRDTLWLVPRPLLRVMTDPRVIKIGIQIRVGDANIKKQHYGSADDEAYMDDHEFGRVAAPYFDCAKTLERDIVAHMGAVDVRWYLMTDTLSLRHTAVHKYGSQKLLAFNTTAIEYYQAVTDVGFQLTVMEHWLLQQATYHIITLTSGLGRTAAFASLRQNNVYTMGLATKNPATKSQRYGQGCRLKEHDVLLDVYDMWSGI